VVKSDKHIRKGDLPECILWLVLGVFAGVGVVNDAHSFRPVYTL
jgi:hypothetical protein